METPKKIYFNDAQLECMWTAANTTVVVAGRRTGKSHGIMAPSLIRDVQAMPRSAGAIVASTFQQALTRTLPATFAALHELGFIRDKHFVIGKKPPKSLGFNKPIIEPSNYEHVIAWYNGAIQHIISQDVKGSSNSLTLDYIKIDEAKFVNFEKLKDETLPANGGITKYFGNCPWHHGLLIMSDMPQTKKGSWFMNYQEQMDSELIDVIHAIICEIYQLKQKPATKAIQQNIKTLNAELAQLRQVATYYREWSSIENIQILGEKYIKQMKRDLPPLVFWTSILCQRLKKILGGFYPALNEDVHFYSAYDNSYLSNIQYDFKQMETPDCRQDGDVNLSQPLNIAFDYNANINWLIVGQQSGAKMKTLKSFYVKYERKLRELCQDFCKYYQYHKSKEVNYYYDNTALGSNYAVNDEDFAAVVCDELSKSNWTVNRVHIGNPLKHHEKHIMIDQALKGQRYMFPMFNKPNNEDLITAMLNADVSGGYNGFVKNKAGEKLPESEEDPLQYRTDGTDAWDTLFIGMNLYPQAGSISIGSAF
jgi:hypothetical protein